MKQLITTFFISLSIALVGAGVVLPSVAQAATDAKSAVCEGAGMVVVGASGCAPPAGAPQVETALERGMNLFSAIIGIIAVVMMMVGGIKYMTSQGESGQTAAAKNTILYAAIGLVIVALAQIFVKFILRRFTT